MTKVTSFCSSSRACPAVATLGYDTNPAGFPRPNGYALHSVETAYLCPSIMPLDCVQSSGPTGRWGVGPGPRRRMGHGFLQLGRWMQIRRRMADRVWMRTHGSALCCNAKPMGRCGRAAGACGMDVRVVALSCIHVLGLRYDEGDVQVTTGVQLGMSTSAAYPVAVAPSAR